MTEPLFFDTDCLSAFLWVREENLLLKLYPGRLVLPQQVFDELSHPSIPHIGNAIRVLQRNNDISTMKILANTEEADIYYELTRNPMKGIQPIGKGEAAAIALTKVHDGILASNNTRDIVHYIAKYKLKHITTGEILAAALDASYITESEGNAIWANMLARKRFLPAPTFSDYLKKHKP